MDLKTAISNLLAAWGNFDAALKADPATAVHAAAPVASPAPIPMTPDWPHIIQAGGMNILAYAPLNPAWKSENMMTMILGGGYGMGSAGGVPYVADPSNGMKAKPVQPLRSPAGFPLTYTLAPDGAVIGSASVSYGEHAFNNDAEVLDYIKRVEDPARFETASTWTAVGAAIGNQGSVSLPPTPPLPVVTPPPGGEEPIDL